MRRRQSLGGDDGVGKVKGKDNPASRETNDKTNRVKLATYLAEAVNRRNKNVPVALVGIIDDYINYLFIHLINM